MDLGNTGDVGELGGGKTVRVFCMREGSIFNFKKFPRKKRGLRLCWQKTQICLPHPSPSQTHLITLPQLGFELALASTEFHFLGLFSEVISLFQWLFLKTQHHELRGNWPNVIVYGLATSMSQEEEENIKRKKKQSTYIRSYVRDKKQEQLLHKRKPMTWIIINSLRSHEDNRQYSNGNSEYC